MWLHCRWAQRGRRGAHGEAPACTPNISPTILRWAPKRAERVCVCDVHRFLSRQRRLSDILRLSTQLGYFWPQLPSNKIQNYPMKSLNHRIFRSFRGMLLKGREFPLVYCYLTTYVLH